MKLNADWPEYNGQTWQSADPHEELVSAFGDYPRFMTATAPAETAEPFTFEQIARITDYDIRSDGSGSWQPGGLIGTELDAVMVGELKDGRWFSAAMWNDYTGWGCQSGVEFRVAANKSAVYLYGLDESERQRLGIHFESSMHEGSEK